MSLSDLLRDYARYNHWANALIVNWLREKSADLMTCEVPSSFPSLQGTLLHIWDAENVWLERLTGTSPNGFPSQNFAGTAEDVFAGLLKASADLRDFLLGQPDDFFQKTLDYRFFNGQPGASLVAQMVQHCIQHSTFHRGQIVTIARNLGLTDPPKTDYIHFSRLKNS